MSGRLSNRPMALFYCMVVLLGAVALAMQLLPAAAAHLTGSPATYTVDADFDEGTLNNVVHTPSDQLQLANVTEPFGFIWVAVSTKGTVVKIDTATGAVLGEYLTSPDGRSKDPSRTTVDLNGNVWVTNRAEGSWVPFAAIQSVAGGDPLNVPPAGSGMGSLTHVALEESGQCVDRNGNGVIDTSTGLGDVRPWLNGSGTDDDYGKLDKDSLLAADECIIHYTRVNSTGTRHVSVNTANDVWVSGTGDRDFDLVDGDSGRITRQAGSVGLGGYGGLITGAAGAEVIWSARPMLRWPVEQKLTPGDSGGVAPITYQNLDPQTWGDSYGLCVDSTGNVWVTHLTNNTINKFAANGTLLGTYSHGNYYAQGCVADSNGHIWVAHSLIGPQTTVGHLLNNGTFVGNVTVGWGPTGVAVDSAGKIWSTNYNSGTVSRIDPNLGPIGGGGANVGAVDFTSGYLGGLLYNYSDMTGSTLSAPPNTGSWTVVHDSGEAASEWGTVSWTADEPGDSSVVVTVRSSEDGVTYGAPETATNNGDLSVPNGRYLKVNVAFTRSSTDGDGDGFKDSPILYDLSVATAGDRIAPTCDCQETTNPSGNNVPKAGVNAGKSGQNPDGFYVLNAKDDTDPNPQVYVRDTGSGHVFGPFPSGTKIKWVQAPGATPTQSPGAGAIDWQLKGKGDAEVFAVDASGNKSGPFLCKVAPLPK